MVFLYYEKVKMRIARYQNWGGELKINQNGKEYTYYDVSPHHLERVENFIHRGYTGRAFRFLKSFTWERKRA